MRRLFSIFILFAVNILFASNLEFVREDISFEITINNQNETYFIVDGLYYFENIGTEKISTSLYYPFPKDSTYALVTEITVENISTKNEDIKMQMKEFGLIFQVKIEANSSAIYNIKYKQKIFSGKAEYILTTSQNWKKPFVEVNYSLHFPKYFTLESLPYTPDTLVDNKNEFFFSWHKEKFMPMKNFIIKFKKKSFPK